MTTNSPNSKQPSDPTGMSTESVLALERMSIHQAPWNQHKISSEQRNLNKDQTFNAKPANLVKMPQSSSNSSALPNESHLVQTVSAVGTFQSQLFSSNTHSFTHSASSLQPRPVVFKAKPTNLSQDKIVPQEIRFSGNVLFRTSNESSANLPQNMQNNFQSSINKQQHERSRSSEGRSSNIRQDLIELSPKMSISNQNLSSPIVSPPISFFFSNLPNTRFSKNFQSIENSQHVRTSNQLQVAPNIIFHPTQGRFLNVVNISQMKPSQSQLNFHETNQMQNANTINHRQRFQSYESSQITKLQSDQQQMLPPSTSHLQPAQRSSINQTRQNSPQNQNQIFSHNNATSLQFKSQNSYVNQQNDATQNIRTNTKNSL